MPENGPLPNRTEGSRIFSEWYKMSYVVSKALELQNYKNCNITTFTKLCTNYAIDWKEQIFDYLKSSQAGFEPNWFGMVAYIKVPVVRIKAPERFRESSVTNQEIPLNPNLDGKFYVNKIEALSGSLSTWNVEEKLDDRRKINYKLVSPNRNSEYFESVLRGDEKIVIGTEKLVLIPIRSRHLTDLESLSQIYKHFNLQELNILASHRDIQKSNECMEYICREWSSHFRKTLNVLSRKPKETPMKFLLLKQCADFSEQIHVKTNFIVNGVPELLKKMDEVILEIGKVSEHGLMEDIRDNMKKRAPRKGDGKSVNYFNELRFKYNIYISKICPLTKAILQIAQEDFERLDESEHAQKIDLLIDRITAEKSILFDKLKYESESIKPDFQVVKDKYFNLINKQDYLFVTGKYSEAMIEESLLEIDDGGGKVWK